MTGAIHRMICSKCRHNFEKFAWFEDVPKITCPDCGAPAEKVRESAKHPAMDYDQPVLSESMGVNPDQVAEHRRMHPDIPILDDGRVVLRNHYEAKRIRKRLGFFDKAGYT